MTTAKNGDTVRVNFTGTLEDEAREYAVVVWGDAGALIISSATIIILNIIKKRRARR